MNTNDIPPALNGKTLLEAFKRAHERRKVIADGFLYGQTINMMSADPGTGKSTVSVQMAVELAAGLPVFGVFHVPRPMKILYFQAERSIIETLERIQTIGRVLPVLSENLFITDEYQKLNLLDPKQADLFIECIVRECRDLDIIFIDPIYACVQGGLKDDIPASAFTKAMSKLQKETGATLWYNHHTVKTQNDNRGNVIQRDDPYYGSQWIKAHVTGSYHLRECNGGVELVLKKDNYRLLPEKIILEYDPETGLCSVPLQELPAIERVKNFIRARERDEKTFYFKDLESTTKVCTRRLREIVMHSSIKDRFEVVSAIKNKKLYRIAQAQT